MYRSLPTFERRFLELRKKDPENPQKYEGVEGGMNFLVLYEQFRRETEGAIDVLISAQGVKKHLSPEMKKLVQIPILTFETAQQVYKLLPGIQDSYNTKYGQVWWLEDQGFTEMNLGNFWTALPESVRTKMNRWQKINLPLEAAYTMLIEFSDLYQDGNVEDANFHPKKIAEFVQKYNRVDGQLDWLKERGFSKVNLGNFWSLIPQSLKEKMTAWQQINLPFTDAETILSGLSTIENTRYDHQYGYVHWLYDMGIQTLNPLNSVRLLTAGHNAQWSFPPQYARLEDLVAFIEDAGYFHIYPLESYARVA